MRDDFQISMLETVQKGKTNLRGSIPASLTGGFDRIDKIYKKQAAAFQQRELLSL
jgi:hypothetical protein